MLTVGAFAQLGGVSAKLLRAYDALGIFSPAWVDPQTGYRFYSPAQLPDLRRIVALRDMGTSLSDIGKALKHGGLREALQRRSAELEHDRETVEGRLASLKIRVDRAELDSTAPDVVMREVKSETAATLSLDLVEAQSADKGFRELEAFARDTKARAARPPGALIAPATSEGGVGALKVEVFVPLSKTVRQTDRIRVRTLPGGRVATLLHRGSYASLAGARRALEEWARAAGLRTERSLRILYLQFGTELEPGGLTPSTVNGSGELLTELQLPVRGD